MITDSVMSTMSPARIAIRNWVRVVIARPTSAPPRASEPVSPMKILAGGEVHHRKPEQAPSPAHAPTPRALGLGAAAQAETALPEDLDVVVDDADHAQTAYQDQNKGARHGRGGSGDQVRGAVAE